MRLLSYLFTLFFAFNALAAAPYGIKGQSQSGTLYSNVHQFPNNQVTNLGGINALVETGNKNILVNPGFEHSTFSTGWTNSAGTFTEETVLEIDGLKAAKLVLSSQTMSLTQSSTLYASQFADGVQGLAMVRVKSDVALKVCAIQAGVVSTSLCVDVPAHNKWGLYKVPFILGATSNGISIASASVTGTVYIDDAFVGAVDLSATQSFDTTCDTIACATEFSAYMNSSGTITTENVDWVNANCTRSGTSNTTYSCPLKSGVFTVQPVCTAQNDGNATNGVSITTSTTTMTGGTFSSGTFAATGVYFVCQKQGADYVAAMDARKAFQKTKVSSFSSTNADTDWASCGHTTSSFTGFGTVTNINTRCKRDGGDLLMTGRFTTGITTATEARVALMLNGVALTSKSTSAIPALHAVGVAGRAAAQAIAFYNTIEPSVAHITFSAQGASSDIFTKLNGSSFGSTETLVINARIPINGWENSNIIIGQFNGLESCTDSYQCTDTFSASADGSANVSQENINWISGNGSKGGTGLFTYTFAAGVFTVAPNCEASTSGESTSAGVSPFTCGITSISSSAVSVACRQGTTLSDRNHVLICQKQGSDYIGKTAKAVASDQNLKSDFVKSVLYSVRVGGASANSNCTTSPCTLKENLSSFVSSVTRSVAGSYTMNFTAGKFANIPNCNCNSAAFGTSAGFCAAYSCTTSSCTVESRTAASAADSEFVISCHGVAP